MDFSSPFPKRLWPAVAVAARAYLVSQLDDDPGFSKALSSDPALRRRPRRLDPEQIKQLVINLIKNSREAQPRAQISVQVTDSDSSFVITVEDTGPGFSPEKLARPFEPYMSTKSDGSGLGLVICQRIAIDHGGTIEGQSEGVGQGATFIVRLPLVEKEKLAA